MSKLVITEENLPPEVEVKRDYFKFWEFVKRPKIVDILSLRYDTLAYAHVNDKLNNLKEYFERVYKDKIGFHLIESNDGSILIGLVFAQLEKGEEKKITFTFREFHELVNYQTVDKPLSELIVKLYSDKYEKKIDIKQIPPDRLKDIIEELNRYLEIAFGFSYFSNLYKPAL